MTAIVARLVLAMLLLPASAALFIILMAVAASTGGPPSLAWLFVVWAIVYSFIASYWVVLWRGVVVWTPRRQALTLVATAAALVCGVLLGSLAMALIPEIPPEIAVLAGGGVVPIFWVLFTVLVWRETGAERMARLTLTGVAAISCPVCGYSLAGLREARCPECGTVFTLDQLLAAQRDHRAAPEP